jgi:hypothetical protein
LFILSNKVFIEFIEAKKELYALNYFWELLVIYYFDFIGIYFNTRYRNNKAQVLYIYNLEFRFLNIYLEADKV